jgi:hypothetical protein
VNETSETASRRPNFFDAFSACIAGRDDPESEEEKRDCLFKPGIGRHP